MNDLGISGRDDCTINENNKKNEGSSVAAWLSETVLRGRGPGASGFESHRRGRKVPRSPAAPPKGKREKISRPQGT
jgi:hypothetical protein